MSNIAVRAASDSGIADLAELSARIGIDPSLTQAATGNTSIKSGMVLWVKASGKWLAHAGRGEIFLPLDPNPALAPTKTSTHEVDQDSTLDDFANQPLPSVKIVPALEVIPSGYIHLALSLREIPSTNAMEMGQIMRPVDPDSSDTTTHDSRS